MKRIHLPGLRYSLTCRMSGGGLDSLHFVVRGLRVWWLEGHLVAVRWCGLAR